MEKLSVTITFCEPMKRPQIFLVFGIILMLGFLGIMAMTCIPFFSEIPNPTATLFVAVIFGVSGTGCFVLSRLISKDK